VIKQLGFSAREGSDKSYKDQITAEWTLSNAAIERIEKARNGGGFVLYPNVQFALISLTAPNWVEPQRPIRVPFLGQPSPATIDAHSWAQNVLEQWRLAAAVSVVVALPTVLATDDHRVVADRLATAKRLLQSEAGRS